MVPICVSGFRNVCAPLAQIGDFGMARDLEDENYYISQGGKIPIKWSSPEVWVNSYMRCAVCHSTCCLQALNFQKYSTASDVWSFGVVMYEIWSLGHKPYEGYTNDQVTLHISNSIRSCVDPCSYPSHDIQTQSLVERGDRLSTPPGCPRAIYKLMMDCW